METLHLPLGKTWQCDTNINPDRVYRFVTEDGVVLEVNDLDLHTPSKMDELIAKTWDIAAMQRQIREKTSREMRTDIYVAVDDAIRRRNFELLQNNKNVQACLTEEEILFSYAVRVSRERDYVSYYILPFMIIIISLFCISSFFAAFPYIYANLLGMQPIHTEPSYQVVQTPFEIPQDVFKGSVHSWISSKVDNWIFVGTISPGPERNVGSLVVTMFSKFDMRKKPVQIIVSDKIVHNQDDTKGIRNFYFVTSEFHHTIVFQEKGERGFVVAQMRDRKVRIQRVIPQDSDLHTLENVSGVSLAIQQMSMFRGEIWIVWVSGDYSTKRDVYMMSFNSRNGKTIIRRPVFSGAQSMKSIKYKDGIYRDTEIANTDEPVHVLATQRYVVTHFMYEKDGIFTPAIQLFDQNHVNVTQAIPISDPAYGTPWGWFCEHFSETRGEFKLICFRQIWNYQNDRHGGVYANIVSVKHYPPHVESGPIIQLAEDSSGHEHSTFLKKFGDHVAMAYVKEWTASHDAAFLLRLFDSTLEHKVGSSVIRKIDTKKGGLTRINVAADSGNEKKIFLTTFQQGCEYTLHVVEILEYRPRQNTVITLILGVFVILMLYPNIVNDVTKWNFELFNDLEPTRFMWFQEKEDKSFTLIDRDGEGEMDATIAGECIVDYPEDEMRGSYSVDGFEWVE